MRKLVSLLVSIISISATLLIGFSGTASANVPGEVSAIWNNSSRALNLGVDHVFDGHYAAGYYDGLLAPGERTDNKWAWGRAEAFFMSSPGYCYSVSSRDINNSSDPWKFDGVYGPYGSGIAFQTPEGYLWQVKRWQVGDSQGACP
jgi:hypothetical protein